MNSKTIRRLITIGLVLAMACVFTLTTDAFLTFLNITNMLKDSAYLGLIALGMSFVIIGGGIDLSAGGIACLVGILCVRMSLAGLPGIAILPIAVLLGMLCGLFNSFLITRIQLTDFVVTLATGFVYTGLTLVFAVREGGHIISVGIPAWSSFRLFGGNLNGIQYITIIWVVLSAVSYLVLQKTRFGLYTYSIGSHAKSAVMSGVNADRIKTIGYLICGGCAGLAVAMQVALNGSSPLNIGTGYEFQAIAACVVGGIVLGGGKGDMIGALIGSLFLIMLMNGLYKYGMASAWEFILQGGIIVLITAFDAIFNKIVDKRLLARTQ